MQEQGRIPKQTEARGPTSASSCERCCELGLGLPRPHVSNPVLDKQRYCNFPERMPGVYSTHRPHQVMAVTEDPEVSSMDSVLNDLIF